MKTIKVIYKGSPDEENFTFNETYLARKADAGRITVLSDSGTLIEMQEEQFVPIGNSQQMVSLEAVL